jgi:hypothetical protein
MWTHPYLAGAGPRVQSPLPAPALRGRAAHDGGALYQSGIPAADHLRDIGIITRRRLPWLRRQMALTVAGGKRGWLR